MSSFTFGLWTGIVAGVVFAALMQQDEADSASADWLPKRVATVAEMTRSKLTTPPNLAQALAQRDRDRHT